MKLWKMTVLLALMPLALMGCPDDEDNTNNTNNKNNQKDMTQDMPKKDMQKEDMTEDMPVDDMGDMGKTKIEVPTTYTFDSKFEAGKSSVSYSGQTARQVLISDLNSYIANQLQMEALTNTNLDSKERFLGTLTYYFEFDGESEGDSNFTLTTTPAPLQTTYNSISKKKNLKGKTAGNDSVTDHKDWKTQFAGWSDTDIASEGGDVKSAEGFVVALMSKLAAQAYDLSQGTAPKDPIGGGDLPVYVTPKGIDLKQMIQKTLLMSIAFSQGTDDYLDSDVDGKGIKASNARAEGKTYTALEHAWDEAFGYFGAARDYSAYDDDEIAGKGGRDGWKNGYYDSNQDGKIDLTSEYNFAASVNAAKRDRKSNDAAKTDYTKLIFDAFLKGRTIITNAGETLTAEEYSALEAQRDIIVLNWEKAIAATVVHYINDTIQESLKGRDSNGYDFAKHAKVWAEMKAFAIGLQFNPKSPLNEGTKFVDLHNFIGDAPVLPNAGEAAVNTYIADLIKARDLMKDAYGFDAANMGDDKGEGGW